MRWLINTIGRQTIGTGWTTPTECHGDRSPYGQGVLEGEVELGLEACGIYHMTIERG